MIAEGLKALVEQRDLDRDTMHEIFGEIMDGKASDVQKSAFLVALRMKGETVEEIAGAVLAMRERVIPLEVSNDSLIDTCGTGGDGHGTFNISTISAIVAAGAGAVVAKHGNRAVSSLCGSADVLSAMGVNIELDAAAMTDVLQRVGIAFLFAPRLHPAMAAVASVRRELGLRTIFNLAGPLTNPAFARRQVLGVYSATLVLKVAKVLQMLGAVHALVVHSEDGMDEISISAPTSVVELRNGELTQFVISPEDLGLSLHPIAALQGGDAVLNAAIGRAVLDGEAGARRDVVLANAGAAIYVSGIAATLRAGVDVARASIDSGAAMRKLDELVAVTNSRGAA